jgi:hypothetical protein
MKVLNTLDAKVVYYDSQVIEEALSGFGSVTGLNATTIQDAIDILFRLVLPSLNFVGGSANTPENQFLVLIDGGKPNTTEFIQDIDGGSPSSAY